ncbi:MAG: hypothetical protein HYU67_04590 [Flavobacteriia bacterium]|nr:hypothetical protein [Flavobacteriia bacterium]
MSYKTITKFSLRTMYGMSQSSLQKLMNDVFFEDLKEAGYQKNMKIIPPKVLKKFYDLFGEPILE